MAKKYDKEYIAKCDKIIREIIDDETEYDDWTQICLSIQDAVQCAATTWGCSTDQQKAQMARFINELVVDPVLKNLTHLDITFKKKQNE